MIAPPHSSQFIPLSWLFYAYDAENHSTESRTNMRVRLIFNRTHCCYHPIEVVVVSSEDLLSQKGDLDVYLEEGFANEQANVEVTTVDGTVTKGPLFDDDGNPVTVRQLIESEIESINDAGSFSYKIRIVEFSDATDLRLKLKISSKYALRSVSISHGDKKGNLVFADGKPVDAMGFQSMVGSYGCQHHSCANGLQSLFRDVINPHVIKPYVNAYGQRKR